MRYLVTTAAISGILCAFAQTEVRNPLIPDPAVTPQLPASASRPRSPFPRPRSGRTASTGAARGGLGNSKPPDVPPETPVITLGGICSNPQTKASCKTVITRQDLDRFVNAYAPNAAGQVRGRLAVQYARTLAYSALAQQQGLDKDPTFAKELAAQLDLVKKRALAAVFLQKLQGKTTAITEAEVQRYYDVHRDEYERVQVRRLSVPLEVPTELARPLTRNAVKPYMAELRKRAAAGEDFNLLQQDAYQYFHIQATPPPVNLTTVDRTTTQGDEAKALDLKPGEVSEVLDSLAAVVILKVESKDTMPLGAVHQEIETTLRAVRMQNLLNKLTKDVIADFNLPYLEMASQPDIFGSAVNSPNQARTSVQLPAVAARK